MLKFLIPALLLSAAPQLASAQQAQAAVAVSYGDLDLRSAEGVARLDRRINAAITKLCTDYARVPLDGQLAISRCVKDSKANAEAQRKVALGKAGVSALAYAGNR